MPSTARNEVRQPAPRPTGPRRPLPLGALAEQQRSNADVRSAATNANRPPVRKRESRPRPLSSINRDSPVKHLPRQDTETGQETVHPSREEFLYAVKGGSLRSPPAPSAAGGRKRPSSPAPEDPGARRPSTRRSRHLERLPPPRARSGPALRTSRRPAASRATRSRLRLSPGTAARTRRPTSASARTGYCCSPG
jgi:hypothetical protein